MKNPLQNFQASPYLACGVLVLSLAGSAALWGYLGLGFRGGNGAGPVGIFLGVIAALVALAGLGAFAARSLAARSPRSAFLWVLAGGAIFRLLVLPAGLSPSRGAVADDLLGRAVGFERFLLYDHDVWRYLWDGHLVAQGVDPYGKTPDEWERRAEAGEPRAVALLEAPPWPDAFEMIAFRDHRTVYPPLAQAAFAISEVLAPGSVLGWKLLLTAVDLATCLLVAALLARLGRERWEVLLYAWNPLVIKEIAGSGHVDALAACGLAAAAFALAGGSRREGRSTAKDAPPQDAAVGWPAAAGALGALALAGLAKVTPLAAAPAFLVRCGLRRAWILPGVLALGCVPFVADLGGLLDGLRAMGARWRFNAGGWDLAVAAGEKIAPQAGAPLAGTLLVGGALAVGAWALRDRSLLGSLRAAYAMLLAFFLLAPAVMPWYAVALMPLAVVVRGRAGLAFSVLAFLSYQVYIDGTEGLAARWIVHLPVWLLLIDELRHIPFRRRSVGP